jgi:hypothetical protein
MIGLSPVVKTALTCGICWKRLSTGHGPRPQVLACPMEYPVPEGSCIVWSRLCCLDSLRGLGEPLHDGTSGLGQVFGFVSLCLMPYAVASVWPTRTKTDHGDGARSQRRSWPGCSLPKWLELHVPDWTRAGSPEAWMGQSTAHLALATLS